MRLSIFAVWALLITALSAQTKMWTWTLEPLDSAKGEQRWLTLQDSLIDSKGNAGLIFFQYRFNGTDGEKLSLRLVWISSKGKVLKDVDLDYPEGEIAGASSGDSEPMKYYRIISVSSSSMTATDGEKVWLLKYNGKSTEITTRQVGNNSDLDVLGIEQPASFKGWFVREVIPSDVRFQNRKIRIQLLSMTLWKALK